MAYLEAHQEDAKSFLQSAVNKLNTLYNHAHQGTVFRTDRGPIQNLLHHMRPPIHDPLSGGWHWWWGPSSPFSRGQDGLL